ncbi:MAG: AAA family ATPase [Lachnospiraceae bacterium]|nr:AAA family ATPase [Lachnospiraceae bacterium]
MKLRACTLMGFGKFYRKSFSFSDGVHVIYGENEAGKTTLRTFLVSMLFGIDRKRGAASKKDEFHKYQPYMGGIYGGTLDLSLDHKPYQIQRNFADPKAISVYSGIDGTKVLEGKELSGQLFSMTKSGYLQTLCISQGEIKTDKSLGQMLNHYMVNMSQSKTTDVNVERALTFLRRELRKQKNKTDQQELSRIKEQIRQSESCEQEIKAIQEQELMIQKKMIQNDSPLTLWERIKAWICKFFGFSDKRQLEQQKMTHQLEMLKVKREQLEQKQQINEDLRIQFENLNKKIKEKEYNKRAIEEAMEAIKEASEEIHQEFGSAFQQKVSDIMTAITDGAYGKIRIDDSMQMTAEQKGSFLDIDYLSAGTVEQIYFAVRLAAAEILFPEEKFPIILDDIFGNFDDKRLKRTLKYLSEQNRQIFIFSCKKEIVKALDQMQCKYQLLEIM